MIKKQKTVAGEGNDGARRHMTYMAALQYLANQSRELARLMPHYGERGRIAEEIIKNVLARNIAEALLDRYRRDFLRRWSGKRANGHRNL